MSECPVCGQPNRDDARFCANCGNALETPCPVCGTPDIASARFCRSCGNPRRADAAPPVPTSAGDRRVATVLFADLAGSTAVAERLDPEHWADIAGEALAIMARVVDRYGGTVARFMGDGILAFFGAPVAHEDDAERAARSALDLVSELEALRGDVTGGRLGPAVELSGSELAVRVGINTGQVVAGAVGSDSRAEYTALGDAVNLAARLEQTAQPGGIQISEHTRRLVSHVVETSPAGALDLKGKAEPVEVHLVSGLRTEREPGSGVTAPLVGRVDELTSLGALVTALGSGRGGIGMLIGEAGLGKSRLLADLRDSIRAKRPQVGWYETAALSFESTTPFSLARRMVTAIAGDGRDGLDHRLGHVEEERRRRLVDHLLGLGGAPHESSMPDAEPVPAMVAEAFAELVAGLVGAGGKHPCAVLVVDDLQWSDAASTDLAVTMLAHTDRHPLAIIGATRPERRGPGWRVKQEAETDFPHRYTEVLLNPLPASQSHELARALLDRSVVSDDDLDRIAAWSEGNPFYLEELVREMAVTAGERGEGVAAPALPESLQNLLQARFDRLDDDTRTTLETAAVIGREFDRGLLAAVRGVDVGSHLTEMLRVGLLDTSGGDDFRFRHALTQEAAYRSILHRRRRELHRTIADAIESAAGPGAAAPILAFHHLAAGDAAEGTRFCLLAGDSAVDVGALSDALGHYDRGLDAVGDSVAPDVTVRLLRGRGRARDLMGDLDGGRGDLEEALERARTLAEPTLEFEVLVTLGELWAARDYTTTGDYFRQALAVARETGDPTMIATSLNRVGNWHVNAADPIDGVAMHREALEIFESLHSVEGLAATHDLLGMANMLTGRMAEANRNYDLAIAEFRVLGNRAGVAGGLMTKAFSAANYETITQEPLVSSAVAIEYLREGIDLASGFGWPAGEAFARATLCQVLGAAGRLGESLEEGRRALEIARRIGHDQWTTGALCSLGSAELDAFAWEEAEEHLTEACRLAERIGSKNWALVAAMSLGRLLVAIEEDERAARLISDALVLDPAGRFFARRGCMLVEAMIRTRRGDRAGAAALVADIERLNEHDEAPGSHPLLSMVKAETMEDASAAAATLEEALATCRRWGMGPSEWRIGVALARVQPAKAETHLAGASSVLEVLGETLTDDGARETMRRRAAAVSPGG